MQVRLPSGRDASAVWPGLDERSIEGIRSIGAYSAVIVLAEILGVVLGAIVAAVIDAMLIPVLLAQFVRGADAPYRRLLPVLALVALLRTLSVAAVVPRLPVYSWYALIGVPLLVGAVLATRLIDEPAARLGLGVRDRRLDTLVAASGLEFGFIGFQLLRPPPLVESADPATLVVVAAILVVFGAFLEELIFRGLLQTVAIEAFGFRRTGVAYAAGLSACLYLGSGSLAFTVEMAVLGAVFGAALLRGASLWGLTIGHAIMLVSMAILWPALFG